MNDSIRIATMTICEVVLVGCCAIGCSDGPGSFESCIPCVSGILLDVPSTPIEDGESTLMVEAAGEVIGTCVLNKSDMPSVAVVCDSGDIVVTLDDDIFTAGDGSLVGVAVLREYSDAVDVHVRLDTPTDSVAASVEVQVQESGGGDCGPVCTGGRASVVFEAVHL